MVEFDLEKYLDGAGVPKVDSAPCSKVVFDPKTWNLTLANDDVRKKASEEHQTKRWYNEIMYKPGCLLTTKTGFPLCFKNKSDGSLWADSDDFNKSAFFIPAGITFTAVEEGIVKVGRITPEQGWSQRDQARYKGCSTDFSSFPEHAFYELRFLKGITFIDSYVQNLNPGPLVFYLLFDRDVGKTYCDANLFEVGWEPKPEEKRQKLRTVDYRSVLTIEPGTTCL